VTPGSAPQARPAVVGGSLDPDADVPDRYRSMITAAARRGPSRDVTPALIAGVVKVASNFDPKFHESSSGRIGIAGWTSDEFIRWAAQTGVAGSSRYSATDSIAALGSHLCSLNDSPLIKALPDDRALLLAAAHHGGPDAVVAAGGIPDPERAYVKDVERYARRFEQPLTVRISADCVVGRCIATRPVLIRRIGATKGGLVRTTVLDPGGVDRNISNPGSYRPDSRADRDGANLGIWYYEDGDPLGVWVVLVTDLTTGSSAWATFRVRR
jgi:hypothetical protein